MYKLPPLSEKSNECLQSHIHPSQWAPSGPSNPFSVSERETQGKTKFALGYSNTLPPILPDGSRTSQLRSSEPSDLQQFIFSTPQEARRVTDVSPHLYKADRNITLEVPNRNLQLTKKSFSESKSFSNNLLPDKKSFKEYKLNIRMSQSQQIRYNLERSLGKRKIGLDYNSHIEKEYKPNLKLSKIHQSRYEKERRDGKRKPGIDISYT